MNFKRILNIYNCTHYINVIKLRSMSEVFGKKKLSALLMASLLSVNLVCSADTYKNNVVDVRVNGESGNVVKVTIYTDKPYSDPVVVNKKANNKYVILLPETNSSLKASPTVTNASSTVSNVSVNTQNVTGGKGYTKIVITSEKTINVVPRTQQLTSRTVQKPTAVTTVLKTDSPVNTKKIVSNQQTDKKINPKTNQQTTKKQTVSKPQQTPQQVKPKQSVVQTPPTKPIIHEEPIKVLEKEVKTGQYANVETDINDEVLNKEISSNLSDKKNNENIVVEPTTYKKNIINNIKIAIKNYQQIDLWKLILLAGAITFPIIVIMIILIMDKKINKKIDKSFKKEEEDYIPKYDKNQNEYENTSSFPENTTSIPIYENINNNEYEENKNTTDIQAETYNSDIEEEFMNDFVDTDFEHDFSQPEETVIDDEINEETTDISETDINVESMPEPYNPDGYLSDFSNINDKDFIDELTIQTMAANNSDGLPEETPADKIFDFMQEDDLSDNKNSNNIQDNIAESDNELKMLTEVKIDDNTGLYLVNYENFSSLVGHINDNYYVIKKFDSIISGKVILKQAEKLKDSTRYLVRIGTNKMVIEVSNNSITKLLDL